MRGNVAVVLAALAATAAVFVPAPPVVHVVYGPVDQNLNGTSALVSAYTDVSTNTIYLPRGANRFMRGHETGHLFDAQALTDGDREYFRKLMVAPHGPWSHAQTYGRVEGEISPNEWFADYYGASAAKLDGLHGRSTATAYAVITPKRMTRFQKALGRLAKRRGLTTPFK